MVQMHGNLCYHHTPRDILQVSILTSTNETESIFGITLLATKEYFYVCYEN